MESFSADLGRLPETSAIAGPTSVFVALRESDEEIAAGGVGAVIGGFEPAVWTVLRVRPVMEAAVGEGAAQALVEEEEEEGDLDALG